MTPLEWRYGTLRFLDQTRLPRQEEYVETTDVRVVAEAIKRLAIRGAPLIGIAGAYGVALAAVECPDNDRLQIRRKLDRAITLLSSTRPTAVNLFWALERQRTIIAANDSLPIERIRSALLEEAQKIHAEDAAMCEAIGRNGAGLLPPAASVLTHCNAGALATGGIGTAIGIIRTAWHIGTLRHVYVDETRPLLQGARLTAWELTRLGIPMTLLPDNAAAFLMQRSRISAVVVGADRITMNGDVANKVGTYNLAVLARHHNIPMYVAAPSSTLDFSMKTGAEIPIEQRSGREVTEIAGTAVAPEGVEVYSPAFDVTPGELVTAIVTEQGVVKPPYENVLSRLKRPGFPGDAC